MSQGISYLVDIVLCIDTTGSMSPVLDEVKASALKFYSSVESKMSEKSKRIDKLRMRVIGFKDFWADSVAIDAMPDFIDMRSQATNFESFVKGLSATGGGDEPESALEALALAIQSPWSDVSQAKGRRIVVMWTDASAHPLEKGASSHPSNYPKNMPKNLDELSDMWEELPQSSRRLLLYAPDASPWNIIGSHWGETIHYPSQAGRGLEEHDMDAILEAIANSI